MKSDLPERTFEFSKQIVRLCQRLDGSPGVPRTLANQLLRSGTSIGANIEEGQASQSEADFVSKYSIACKRSPRNSLLATFDFGNRSARCRPAQTPC